MRAFSGYALSFVPWWNFTPSTILASHSNARSRRQLRSATRRACRSSRAFRRGSDILSCDQSGGTTVAKLDSITFELRMWIILAP